jgi:hypothetical protein
MSPGLTETLAEELAFMSVLARGGAREHHNGDEQWEAGSMHIR